MVLAFGVPRAVLAKPVVGLIRRRMLGCVAGPVLTEGFRSFPDTSDAPLSRLVVLGFAVRIVERSGDHVAPADPFAEINQAAAVRAERKIRLSCQQNLAAGGTTERSGLLLRHGRSQVRRRCG